METHECGGMESGKRSGKRLRQKRILEELRVRPAVRVSELAAGLGVHTETIRRDLTELQSEGEINRTYGGALPASAGVEASLDERDRLLTGPRTHIADVASKLIDAGDVVMVDVGSTTTHFGRRLAARALQVRVITNSWKLASVPGPMSPVSVLLCPGEFSHEQGGVAGSDTAEFLRRFHADKAVLSAGGITEEGLFEFDPSFAWIKRIMLERSQERILIIDHSKFGRKVMDRVSDLSVFDHIVLDRLPKGRLLKRMKNTKATVHVAEG